MKIAYASDLHLEFAEPDFDLPEADVLLLCGDITTARCVHVDIDFFKSCSEKYDSVFYVFGNHEFYRDEYHKAKGRIYEALHPYDNIYIMDDSHFELNDSTILIGSTLWTNFDYNPLYANIARQGMNDYSQISYGPNYWKLSPEHTTELHKKSLEFIDSVYNEFPNHNVIVMTHHAPSFCSTEPKWAGDLLTYAFCSHLDPFIWRRVRIKHWFHGHVHHRNEYYISDDQMIHHNPRGYPNEIREPFQIKVIEV